MAGMYFFDDFALDRRVQVERTYVQPERLSSEPYQGTNGFITYPSVHWCPEQGCYRMWHGIISDTATHQHVLGLAESRDCLHWQDTGYVYAGLGNVHGAIVYRDPYEQDPAQLYKMAASTSRQEASPGREDSSVVLTSPDGVTWDDAGMSRRWGEHRSDTSNCLFYNPVRDCYQILHRPVFIDRRVASTWSKDLTEWSEPELVVHPDPLDPPCCQLYGMTAFPAEDIFIGFLLIYETDMLDLGLFKMGGRLTTELVYSYDGFHWNRTHHRVIPYPQYPDFGAGIMAVQTVTEDPSGETWKLAVSAPRLEHGVAFTKKGEMLQYNDPTFAQRVAADGIDTRNNGVLIYETRKMGLVGLQGNVRSSSLCTKPIRLNSGALALNLSAPCGRATFQISDGSNTPLPGFTFDECVPFSGDSVCHEPRWQQHSLQELQGQRIRIEITLHMATLYAITGDFSPYHGTGVQAGYGSPAKLEERS